MILKTSMVRQSLSFLHEAKMVSEVANSKYQSLFFILKKKGGRGIKINKRKKERSNFWIFNSSAPSPAVEPLGVFLSHGMEAVGDGGILHTSPC